MFCAYGKCLGSFISAHETWDQHFTCCAHIFVQQIKEHHISCPEADSHFAHCSLTLWRCGSQTSSHRPLFKQVREHSFPNNAQWTLGLFPDIPVVPHPKTFCGHFLSKLEESVRAHPFLSMFRKELGHNQFSVSYD